jgi:hypothetical protein
MKRTLLALLGLVAACGGTVTATNESGDASREATSSSPVDATIVDAGVDANVIDAADGAPDVCADAGVPPSTLECAGLYANFASKTIASNAAAYAPAVPLWSDGATKLRWIELPPGTTIDATDPNEWTFPIGTKLFKEFTYEGKRVETRLFQKVTTGYWVHATYAWNDDDSATTVSYGETVSVNDDAGTWVIPTPDDCDSCHRGRSDRILGFEQVGLGLTGATGLTLEALVAAGLITPAPTNTHLIIGDDGTGYDAPALSWMHVNCGVSCHNANENSLGYGAKMLLRLDPTTLDGSMANSTWDPLKTTINVPCISGSVAGEPRIVPGDPGSSVIVQLMNERGELQMPPLGTRFVDTNDVASVEAWIEHMPGIDAGVDSGSPMMDAGMDATLTTMDAGLPDSASDATMDAAMDVTSDANEDGSVVAPMDADVDGGSQDAETDAE